MHSVENCDISGIHALESLTETYREHGGDIYFVRVQPPVEWVMRNTGFIDRLGEDHLLTGDEAMDYLFHRVLDPAICIYECPVKVFAECQNLPKLDLVGDIHFPEDAAQADVPYVTPLALWEALHGDSPLVVIDVRAPGEFARGHIRQARNVPLPSLLDGRAQVPRELEVVFVCRGGRRSSRAAALFRQKGYDRVSALQGGMLAWEANMLLEAVDAFGEAISR